MGIFETYLLALALTLAIEVPLLAVLAPREHRRSYVRAALLVNLVIHPLANAAYWEGYGSFIEIELAVVLVELLAYTLVLGVRLPRALYFSVLANFATAAASAFFL